MSSSFGKNITIQIFGQSHSEGLGVVIDGLPAGQAIDMQAVSAFLQRRRGGKIYSTKRVEDDEPRVLSGILHGKTCGAPLCAVFENKDVREQDYSLFGRVPRPSHADYNAVVKYGGASDMRGGGHFSGRLTLPLSFAGAVCAQILNAKGIFIGAHIAYIADIFDKSYDAININKEELLASVSNSFPVNDIEAGEKMISAITLVSKEKDSLGGAVECAVIGLPTGVGEPIFSGIESHLSSIIFGIPAVRGVEFGVGFASCQMRGSEHNDAFYFDDKKNVRTRTNNAGGVLGGISTGMPLIFRVAFKPTPSIAMEQESVDLQKKQATELTIAGRHDPCIVPRAVPCVEAAAAIALLDLLLQK